MTISLISKTLFFLLLIINLKGEINFSPIIPIETNKNFSFYDNSQCVNNNHIPKEAIVIDLKKTEELYKSSAIFIDARNNFLFQKGTIKNSISVPSDQFEKKKNSLGKYLDKEIVTFCSGINCGKSTILAQKLIDNGFTKVYIFKEGYPKWKRESLPTESSIVKKEDDPHSIDKKFLSINDEKIALIDVRSKEEFQKGHLKNSINIPITLSTENFLEKLPKNKTIIFVCKSGGRAYDALEKTLNSKTISSEDLFYFDGDINCNREGLCKIIPFVY